MASAGKYVPPHLRNRPALAAEPAPVPAAKPNVCVAGVVLVRRGETCHECLLVQAAWGGKGWTPPKGLLKSLESELGAARREVLEETALRETADYVLASTEPVFRTNYWDSKNKRNESSVYFLGKLDAPDAVVTIQASELAAFARLAAGPA
ncbi:hypothetical protein T492DRAFT_851111 [Pavlovales sp. CCMP2436]|nr:hypothetical protein T492DRAFT_851111 [Pavlovales sp. CCMP2436]